ncbi:MAG: sugar ABC transporter ATP-binding protein [Acetobacteraceae bacterium]|nr:sugar ABC transporter ATP-binding protein [Acetobacteraceae bacterium]MBV8524896.1 sugar ABC transporter ATP-binding protein [Acetobacteraceae bacterium]MBV8589174.1 sugar ABC transporter ATP-binding protein [Acetobacteraceae bacterium]
MANQSTPIIQLTNIGKNYGNFSALKGVNLTVRQGEVTCILGDNGAGKSTLISIIAGLHAHDEGTYAVDGQPVHFSSPREALDRGIATVYQTLAMVPLLSVWRNFFLGSELTRPVIGPFRRLDVDTMWANTDNELRRMGINLADLEQPVGTLSGGQRQVVAIARAIHFGARVLILDEPTAALGVTQSGIVLRYIAAAARQGIAVIFITHNPHHAYMVGHHFLVLQRGQVELDAPRSELSLDNLMFHMAGGAGLDVLEHELHGAPTPAPAVTKEGTAPPAAT